MTFACPSACASAFLWYQVGLREMQTMGVGPIPCICVCVSISTVLNFDAHADAHADANVMCKQSLTSTFAFASNFNDGFYDNKRWCSHLTFTLSRKESPLSKQSTKKSLLCVTARSIPAVAWQLPTDTVPGGTPLVLSGGGVSPDSIRDIPGPLGRGAPGPVGGSPWYFLDQGTPQTGSEVDQGGGHPDRTWGGIWGARTPLPNTVNISSGWVWEIYGGTIRTCCWGETSSSQRIWVQTAAEEREGRRPGVLQKQHAFLLIQPFRFLVLRNEIFLCYLSF